MADTMSDTEDVGDEDVGIDPAIAAAMGFTSFGKEPSRKRRKPNDDAFIDKKAKNPRGQAQMSGANNVTLGLRKSAPVAAGHLEAQGADNGAGNGAKTEMKKSSTKDKPAGASGLAGFLARAQTVSSTPPATRDRQGSEAMAPITKTTAWTSMATVSAEHPESRGDATRTSRSAQPSLEDYRRGVKNDKGDLVIFLPSFLEDPWKDLEKTKT